MINIDARRLLCPLPVIRLQNALKGLSSGTHVNIVCTDPGTHHDIPTWCRLYGHTIQSVETHATDLGDEIRFVVVVA